MLLVMDSAIDRLFGWLKRLSGINCGTCILNRLETQTYCEVARHLQDLRGLLKYLVQGTALHAAAFVRLVHVLKLNKNILV